MMGILCLVLSFSLVGQTNNSFSYSSYFGLPISYPWQVEASQDNIPELVNQILEKTNKRANFRVVAAAVARAAAVIDRGERLILYNPDYMASLEADVLRIAILSHLVGHHVNEHSLRPERYEAEDIAAAEFAGFALYHFGAQEALMEVLPQMLGRPTPPSLEEQSAALLRGFKRAQAALLLAPYSGFDDEGTGTALAGVPEFPFPPPSPSASYDLTDFFTGYNNYGGVAQKIRNALDINGYYEQRYYHLKSGFALVTQLEQFNADGSSKNPPARWSAKTVRNETFSWLDYVKALFRADVGRFRVFVFVVTPEQWAPDSSRRISRKEADQWLSEGANRLPTQIANAALPPNTTVTVLVYEFKVSETRKANMSRPSEISGREHINKANILKILRR